MKKSILAIAISGVVSATLMGCVEEQAVATPTTTPEPEPTTWYDDQDLDGFGEASTETTGDQPEAHWVENGDDCNDADGTIHPDADDQDEFEDSDCDGLAGDDGRKYIFISSTTHTANLGGLAGADAICQDLADNSTLIPKGDVWKAWMSDTNTRAKDRLNQWTKTYSSLDTGWIATSFADLTNSNTDLMSWIYVDENGNRLQDLNGNPLSLPVHTGTMSSGSMANSNCFDWSSESGLEEAIGGDSSRMDVWWTAGQFVSCDTEAHLYCIEQ